MTKKKYKKYKKNNLYTRAAVTTTSVSSLCSSALHNIILRYEVYTIYTYYVVRMHSVHACYSYILCVYMYNENVSNAKLPIILVYIIYCDDMENYYTLLCLIFLH